MTGETIFRNFVEEDHDELNKMILALYKEDAYGEPMSRAKIARTIDELMRHPEKGKITIFEIGKCVVGYAITIYFWSNEFGGNVAAIDEFYVKAEWRNKGIGTTFLDDAAHSVKGNIVGLQLEVTPSNVRAFNYYTQYVLFLLIAD